MHRAFGLLQTIASTAETAIMADNPQEISSEEDDTNLTHSASLTLGKKHKRLLRAKAGSKAKAKTSQAAASSSTPAAEGEPLTHGGLQLLERVAKKMVGKKRQEDPAENERVAAADRERIAPPCCSR